MASPTVLSTTKIYDKNGTYICEFPGFNNLGVQDILNSVGSFSISYPLNATNASNLISDSALQVAILMDFGDGNPFVEVWRGILEQDNYDASMPESAVVTASGRSIVAILEDGRVYPAGGVGTVPAYTSFASQSPGGIMNSLINAAKARGCFPSLSTSFTSGVDSSGNAWTQSLTYSYSAGTDLLTVLTNMASANLVDFSMTGTTLNMYNPGTTLANDRSSTVIYRRGRDVMNLPIARDRTKINTVILVEGDNGTSAEVSNSGQITALGRREGFLSQSGVSTNAALTYFGNLVLGSVDDQQFSYVANMLFNNLANGPMAWRDFKCGDYVGIDINGTVQSYRARTWSIQLQPGAPVLGQITFNDIFYERGVLTQSAINSLSGGSIFGGPVSIDPLPGPNATIPNTPAFNTSQIYTSAYYSPATGQTEAQIQLNWTQPTNTDGSVINDGANYQIRYRVSATPIYPVLWSQLFSKTWSQVVGNPWSNPLATPINTAWTTVLVPFDQTSVTIGDLLCGESYDFEIQAIDVSGNASAYSSVSTFATARDNVAPSTPDAPTVSASMVAVQVMSDLGRASGGTYNLENDLDHLEVHYSYDPSFSPVSGVGSPTYLGKLIANAGMMSGGIAAVGTFQVTNTSGVYIKLIAVDVSGNISAPSAASGVTAVLIDDSHISSLSVSKLIAGTILANIILGASIGTGTSGQRVVMDSTGLHAYDSTGTMYFDLNNTSTTMILSQSAGGPKITLDTIGVYPTIRLFDNGSNNAFINAITDDSNTAALGINSGSYTDGVTTWRNRILMSGLVFGARMEVINDTNQVTAGGRIGVSHNLAYGSIQANNVVDGGDWFLTPTQAMYGLFPAAAAHGGQLLYNYDNTNSDVSVELDGYFSTATPAPAQCLFGIRFTGLSSGTGGVSPSFGTTMYSTTLPIIVYSCGTIGVVGGNVNNLTVTGYSYTLSAASPAAWSIFAIGMRIR